MTSQEGRTHTKMMLITFALNISWLNAFGKRFILQQQELKDVLILSDCRKNLVGANIARPCPFAL